MGSDESAAEYDESAMGRLDLGYIQQWAVIRHRSGHHESAICQNKSANAGMSQRLMVRSQQQAMQSHHLMTMSQHPFIMSQ